MLYVGLDLSRKRLDFDARLAGGELVERGAVPPAADGLAGLVQRLGDAEVLAVVESMSGTRFVHDRLELHGWDVRIADAVKAKGLAPLACKTDRIVGARSSRAVFVVAAIPVEVADVLAGLIDDLRIVFAASALVSGDHRGWTKRFDRVEGGDPLLPRLRTGLGEVEVDVVVGVP